MKGFRAGGEGRVTARFEAGEAAAIVEFAEDLIGRLSSGAEDDALARLFPDAYPGDEGASAEFRRFTEDGLTAVKIENARTVIRALGATERSRVTVSLDSAAAQSWLRTLTDIRLVLATQLGIKNDGDTGFRGPRADRRRALVYAWLAYVQESLIRAL